jgi:hypothetical protein
LVCWDSQRIKESRDAAALALMSWEGERARWSNEEDAGERAGGKTSFWLGGSALCKRADERHPVDGIFGEAGGKRHVLDPVLKGLRDDGAPRSQDFSHVLGRA